MATLQEWIDKANDINKAVNTHNPFHPWFYKDLFADLKGKEEFEPTMELTQEQALGLSVVIGASSSALVLWLMLNPEVPKAIVDAIGRVLAEAPPDVKI